MVEAKLWWLRGMPHWDEPWSAEADEAIENPRFRSALRCVHYGNKDDPSIVARLRRFGPPW